MDPSPTDCISQPIDPPSATDLSFHCLGELFVCPKVAIEESEKRGSTPLNELRLYLVHSFLHLIGYEDHNEEALKKMRQAEEKTLFFLDKKQIHLK